MVEHIPGLGAVPFSGKVSLDMFVVCVALVCAVGLGLLRGRGVLVAAAFSLYPAILFAGSVPLDRVGMAVGGFAHLAVFAAACVAVFCIVRRHVESWRSAGGVRNMLGVVLLAVGVVGLTFAALYHAVGFERTYDFTALLDAAFAAKGAWYAWLAAPAVGLLVLPRV